MSLNRRRLTSLEKQRSSRHLATFCVGTAQAIPLSVLLDDSETITAGDKQFSGFELMYNAASDDSIDPDLADVMVTSLGGDLDPGPGLHFDFGDEFNFNGDASADVMIGFWVTVLDPDLLITDVSLITEGLIGSNTYSNDGWMVRGICL